MKCAVCKVRFGPDTRIVTVENRIVCYIHTQEPTKPDEAAIKSVLEQFRNGQS